MDTGLLLRLAVGIVDSMDVSLSKLQELVKDWEAWRAAVHGVTKGGTQPSDWTTTLRAVAIVNMGLRISL